MCTTRTGRDEREVPDDLPIRYSSNEDYDALVRIAGLGWLNDEFLPSGAIAPPDPGGLCRRWGSRGLLDPLMTVSAPC